MEQNEPQSKSQKKKAKAKEKPQEAEETKVESAKPSKKAGKRGAAAAAALRSRQAAEQEEKELREEEERLRLQQEEEERQRVEEEKTKKIAEEKRIEEIRIQKKLGLLKTPEQLERERKEAVARERFIQAGMVKTQDTGKPAELPSSKRKARKHSSEDQPPAEPTPPPQPVETLPVTQDTAVDDWEAHAEDSEPQPVPESTPLPPEEVSVPAAERSSEEYRRKALMESMEPPSLYKSPVLCILGHVDTGKTKLLDKLRKTNVQLGEAGGITQQIGATFFPGTTLQQFVRKLAGSLDVDVKIPGMLVIDTPGHESFANLRSRGSSLCSLAILVVDIMHGLENQTLESMDLLIKRRIPFIVALNKIDRIYDWAAHPNAPFRTTFEAQQSHSKDEFRKRFSETSVEFAEKKHLNIALYFENPDPESYVNVVPTSAITGEGIPDLISLIVWYSQNKLEEQILYREELQATVLEVKVTEGHGTTVDIILANGTLFEGDSIVVYGLNGPIVTQIRALLTPMPLREMRVKGEYEHNKYIRASCGVKISAQNLEGALAGSPLLVVRDDPDEIAFACQTITADISAVFKSVDRTGEGVYVMASTVGALEALLEYMKASKVPVSGVNIGPVFKKDVMTAQNQIENGYKKEYATILAFDIKVTPEASEYADKIGVKIFTADIIYHLTDQFYKYVEEMRQARKAEEGRAAVFPCVLKVVAIFRDKDPMVLGVDVLSGVLKIGTPLCVPDKANLPIGKVVSIELNHKPQQDVRSGAGSVAIKLEPTTNESATVVARRHFDEQNQLASLLTRESIDALKEYFMDDMPKDDWKLVKALKTTFGIV